MSFIKFDKVSLTFPGTSQPAIHQCSFEIFAGELIVIVGASGCGKTTLLKMVNRLYEPTEGNIYLDNKNIQTIPGTKLRRKIGYVIQQSGLFPHMSVAENIAIVPKLLNWSKNRVQNRVEQLLNLVHLPPQKYQARYPSQLSGGQQQRVGIARALAANPETILMDEPFGALDAITRKSLQDEVLSLQRQLKKTILFVSHDIEEALRLADRIMILDQGKIIQFDTPFKILAHPASHFVQELIGGDDQLRQLTVLSVESVMTDLPADPMTSEPDITAHQNLRQALFKLLSTGKSSLIVTQNGDAIGTITLENIRQVLKR